MYRGSYSSPFNRTEERRRQRFHQLGLVAAVVAMALGTTVIAAGVVRLELWEVLQQDTLAIVLGCTFVALVLVCLAIYTVFRAVDVKRGPFKFRSRSRL